LAPACDPNQEEITVSEIKTTIIEQLQQLQMLMHRATFHAFGDEVRTHNPHRGQGRILAVLKMKPEISQRELSYLLNMSKQSLAELLAKMEKNNYITREQSKDDKRVMTIKLTEDGAKAADEVDDDTSETPQVLDCLTDEELGLFSEYLGRVIKRYEEQFPGEDFEQRRRAMEEFMLHHRHGFGGRFGRLGDFDENADNPGGGFRGGFGWRRGHHRD